MIYKGAVVIKGEIHCMTGLHIGGGGEALEIGGLDKPVIRHPLSRRPYIPGSSLKGKMRSLLELALDKVDANKWLPNGGKNNEYGAAHRFGKRGANCEGHDCPICLIFGAVGGSDADLGPARLIVRDATLKGILVRDAFKDVGALEKDERPLTEIKWENTINRITATTTQGGLRQMERVPAGAVFDFELVYRVFERVGEKTQRVTEGEGSKGDLDLIPKIVDAMKMLADDTLGGSGSRGYGQIKFRQVRVNAPETLKDAKKKFDEALPKEWYASAPATSGQETKPPTTESALAPETAP